MGDKVGGPCSYRDDVEPSAVSETSIPLPQHPLCEIPAPLADPQHGQGSARPPMDTFCQGEKVLETPKGLRRRQSGGSKTALPSLCLRGPLVPPNSVSLSLPAVLGAQFPPD